MRGRYIFNVTVIEKLIIGDNRTFLHPDYSLEITYECFTNGEKNFKTGFASASLQGIAEEIARGLPSLKSKVEDTYKIISVPATQVGILQSPIIIEGTSKERGSEIERSLDKEETSELMKLLAESR